MTIQGYQFNDSSQVMHKKCMNNVFEYSDTFDVLLCDSVLMVVWLNASSTGYQRPFQFKDISVIYGNATVQ